MPQVINISNNEKKATQHNRTKNHPSLVNQKEAIPVVYVFCLCAWFHLLVGFTWVTIIHHDYITKPIWLTITLSHKIHWIILLHPSKMCASPYPRTKLNSKSKMIQNLWTGIISSVRPKLQHSSSRLIQFVFRSPPWVFGQRDDRINRMMFIHRLHW